MAKIGRILTGALCAGRALACVISTTPATAQSERVQTDKPFGDCNVPVPAIDAEPEWVASENTMVDLIGSGSYEIRGSYRLDICGFGLSVYVLQNVTDRRLVFECVSDDQYRPPFPCQHILPLAAESGR